MRHVGVPQISTSTKDTKLINKNVVNLVNLSKRPSMTSRTPHKKTAMSKQFAKSEHDIGATYTSLESTLRHKIGYIRDRVIVGDINAKLSISGYGKQLMKNYHLDGIIEQLPF